MKHHVAMKLARKALAERHRVGGPYAMEAGFEPLSSGYFSYVYSAKGHPRVVIKIAQTNHAEGDGWVPYIKWARKSRSIHAPRVYAIVEDTTYTVAVMERLVPFSSCSDLLDPETVSVLTNATCHRNLNNFGEGSLKRFCKRITNDLPDWWHDMHSNNLMLRKDGTPVVVDPLSFPTDEAKRRKEVKKSPVGLAEIRREKKKIRDAHWQQEAKRINERFVKKQAIRGINPTAKFFGNLNVMARRELEDLRAAWADCHIPKTLIRPNFQIRAVTRATAIQFIGERA